MANKYQNLAQLLHFEINVSALDLCTSTVTFLDVHLPRVRREVETDVSRLFDKYEAAVKDVTLQPGHSVGSGAAQWSIKAKWFHFLAIKLTRSSPHISTNRFG